MSIPLVQKPEKDDINTSIIAIKRNIERINMLLGLVDSSSPDLSGFVKKSDIVDVVESDNMNPVTSNAVFDATKKVTTYTPYTGVTCYKCGKIVQVQIAGNYNAGDTAIAIPIDLIPIIGQSGILHWGQNIFGYYDVTLNGYIYLHMSSTTNAFASFTYMTAN